MAVDGFRFDLASGARPHRAALRRSRTIFYRTGADPLLARVKLIAEHGSWTARISSALSRRFAEWKRSDRDGTACSGSRAASIAAIRAPPSPPPAIGFTMARAGPRLR